MYIKEVTHLVQGVTEAQAKERLRVAFSVDKPDIRDTSEGNTKMIVRGWSIILIPKDKDTLLVLRPLWVNDHEKAMLNLDLITTIIINS